MYLSEWTKIQRGKDSIRGFARQMGVSNTYIKNIESGKYDRPTPLQFARICMLYSAKPEEMINKIQIKNLISQARFLETANYYYETHPNLTKTIFYLPDTIIKESVGERIKEARANRGMSRQELAYKLKRDYTFINKYELGRRFPKDKLLVELGNILDVSPLWLKYGDETILEDNYGKLIIKYCKNEEKNDKNMRKL